MAEVRIFGIRHHGPGSARSLVNALTDFAPDVVVMEGPPEAEPILAMAMHEGMTPPVAILLYAKDDPRKAIFYPLAEFSPEWQAIRYACSHEKPIRLMDLAAGCTLAAMGEDDEELEEEFRHDPLRLAAEAAGYTDSERWWEDMVERRQDATDIFAAVLELMTALRTDLQLPEPPREKQREAQMRLTIRQASKEFEKVAVVCGAWHGPALLTKATVSEDTALLKNVPKVKTEATWVPWTYELLSFRSGYGAGVLSPAYYEHLWLAGPQRASERWLIHTARMLRDEDLEASPASAIEALRLAETLASVRNRPLPGLAELRDAALSVLCGGKPEPMMLVERRLIFGERMGEVPETVPLVPLQADLTATQKRLRIKPEASQKKWDLDLRQQMDLERSHLLHRLNILEIKWGTKHASTSRTSTFHEFWITEWRPEYAISLIQASRWGTTVESAATGYAMHLADEARSLKRLSELTSEILLADLGDAVEAVTTALQNVAALSTDVGELLDSLPSLAEVLRYGNVRGTDASAVQHVFQTIFTRAVIGLPASCVGLDDDAARTMANRIATTAGIVRLLQDEELAEMWRLALLQVADGSDIHGQISGKTIRVLLELEAMDRAEVALRFGHLASSGAEPVQTAGWIEGFLSGSGMLLVHDASLLSLMDGWVAGMDAANFELVLPLVRRTFSMFPRPERRQIGEQLRSGKSSAVDALEVDIDEERAEMVMPLLGQIFDLEEGSVAE